MAKSYVRAANLRAWLNRKNCPQVIKEFKILFDNAFSRTKDMNLGAPAQTRGQEHAHFTYRDVTYSRASIHLGNSLVSYLPPSSGGTPVVGSIQKITTSGDTVVFSIKRQARLPASQPDPFMRYPLLGAKTYSSKMSDGPEDVVSPIAVLNHVARYNFTSDRCVILNLSKVSPSTFCHLLMVQRYDINSWDNGVL